MGKYSDFDRIPQDAYQTPERPVHYLLPHLHGIRTFAEPCVGEGQLKRALEKFDRICAHEGDIKTGQDALTDPLLETRKFDAIITNPPWTRDVMHAMIRRFMMIAPTWLLFDSDWAFNVDSGSLIKHCSTIVPVGRVKWFPGTSDGGKVNCAWYRFHVQHVDGPRLLHRIALPATPRKQKQKELADAA